MSDLTYAQSVLLGVVEGLSEFLPISSTGHLTITEGLLGLDVDSTAITSFTAVIQLGAIAATLLYFARDIVRLVVAWVRGLRDQRAPRGPELPARLVRHRRDRCRSPSSASRPAT